MLWDCMLRRWLGEESEPTEGEDYIDPRTGREERVRTEGRYAEMRAYLGYPS
jgi:hypothetical protein